MTIMTQLGICISSLDHTAWSALGIRISYKSYIYLFNNMLTLHYKLCKNH